MARILLVDDSESNRLTLSALLEEEGFAVETAASFAEGRGKLCQQGVRYDLLVSDQNLGDGLGTDLVKLVRAGWPGTKAVIVSGTVATPTALPVPVDGFVRKGGEVSETLELILRLAKS